MNVDDQPPSKKRRSYNGRVRVTRACDLCKKKKLRCSGTQPCSQCVQVQQRCAYEAEYNRGRPPNITAITAETVNANRTSDINPDEERDDSGDSSLQQKHTFAPLPETLSTVDNGTNSSYNQNGRQDPDSPRHQDQDAMIDTTALPHIQLNSYTQEPGPSSRNSPEPVQTDQEGHYVGPASGVSFLSRALKRLHNRSYFAPNAQDSFIFNFADAPLPQHDPYFLIVPSKDEAKALIHRYFDFACPTHRFLHQPSVEMWYDRFYDSINNPKPLEPGDREIRAILLMVLAQAKTYTSPKETASYDNVNSAAYFAASEHHLLSETGGIRLTSIQARLIQCFYLLSQSRVNSAWSLFGTVANLALAMGLHRRKTRDNTSSIDLVVYEYRKRVFWSAYTLDSYLSVGLGRPRSFHEEDIDQEFPLCVDDAQITRTKILPSQQTEQSVTLASICHAKLSKIISSILRDLYGVKRLSIAKQVEVIQVYDSHLIQWRDNIHGFLDIPNTGLMMTIYRRQHTVLQLAHSHAVILLHRQALLRRFSASATDGDNTLQTASQYSVRRCLEAATTIVGKLRELVEKKQMYSAFWFTHYYVFSALVALYIYVVQSRSKPAHNWKPYLELAQQGLRDLSACSTETSYAHRYVVVLSELQNEAMRIPRQSRQAFPETRIQPPCVQSVERAEHFMSTDLAVQAVTTIPEDETSLPEQLQSRMNEFDSLIPEDSELPFQYDGFQSDLLNLPNLDSREAFGNLAVEGLADLEFLFPTEDVSDLRTEGDF